MVTWKSFEGAAVKDYFNGSLQDGSNSIANATANAMESPQSCHKSSI